MPNETYSLDCSLENTINALDKFYKNDIFTFKGYLNETSILSSSEIGDVYVLTSNLSIKTNTTKRELNKNDILVCISDIMNESIYDRFIAIKNTNNMIIDYEEELINTIVIDPGDSVNTIINKLRKWYSDHQKIRAGAVLGHVKSDDQIRFNEEGKAIIYGHMILPGHPVAETPLDTEDYRFATVEFLDEYLKTVPVEYGVRRIIGSSSPLMERIIREGDSQKIGSDTELTSNISTASSRGESSFDMIYPWSEIHRCVLDDSGKIIAYEGEPGYSLDLEGHHMVEIPIFYQGYEYNPENDGYEYFWISDSQVSSRYYLNPLFVKEDGTVRDKIYIGISNLTDIVNIKSQNGNVYESANKTKLVQFSKDIVNSVFDMVTDTTFDIIRYLFLIEYATFSSCIPLNPTMAWNVTANMNTGSWIGAGAGTQSAALAFGGQGDGVYINNSELFNGMLWTTTTGLNISRSTLAGCGVQSAALSFGGMSESDLNSTVTEKWDGTAWASTGAMNTGRRGLAGCGTQSAALSFGGLTGTVKYKTTESFNGSTWSATGNMNTARCALAGAGIQSAALSFGGDSGGYSRVYSAITELFNGSTWTTTGDMNAARTDLAGAGTQSAALSFGGYNIDAEYASTTEEFNGSTWSTASNLNTGRWYLSGDGAQSTALSFGGMSESVILTVTEKYQANSKLIAAGSAYDCKGSTGTGTRGFIYRKIENPWSNSPNTILDHIGIINESDVALYSSYNIKNNGLYDSLLEYTMHSYKNSILNIYESSTPLTVSPDIIRLYPDRIIISSLNHATKIPVGHTGSSETYTTGAISWLYNKNGMINVIAGTDGLFSYTYTTDLDTIESYIRLLYLP